MGAPPCGALLPSTLRLFFLPHVRSWPLPALTYELRSTGSDTVCPLKSELRQITFWSYLRFTRQRLLHKHWNFSSVLTRRLADSLEKTRLQVRTVTIKLRYANFATVTVNHVQ